MKISVKCHPCPGCNIRHRVAVEEADFYDWQNGKLIEDAFPYLTPEQRELLITGYDKKCWDELFTFLEGEL